LSGIDRSLPAGEAFAPAGARNPRGAVALVIGAPDPKS